MKSLNKIEFETSAHHVQLLIELRQRNEQLLELSPGETVGAQGLQLALEIEELTQAAAYLYAAAERLKRINESLRLKKEDL